MKFKISKYLADLELSSGERREVLEDLFVFGKENLVSDAPLFIAMVARAPWMRAVDWR